MSPQEAMTPQQWKSKSSVPSVEVPSGNIARIRRKALTVFMKTGMIPNDLLPIIQKALNAGRMEVKADELMATPQLITSTLELIDMVVVECVVEPKVYPVPEREDQRDPELLYVDEVDWTDKQFIFAFVVGAVEDVAAFRRQQEGDVAAVPTSDDVAGTPVEPASIEG